MAQCHVSLATILLASCKDEKFCLAHLVMYVSIRVGSLSMFFSVCESNAIEEYSLIRYKGEGLRDWIARKRVLGPLHLGDRVRRNDLDLAAYCLLGLLDLSAGLDVSLVVIRRRVSNLLENKSIDPVKSDWIARSLWRETLSTIRAVVTFVGVIPASMSLKMSG